MEYLKTARVKQSLIYASMYLFLVVLFKHFWNDAIVDGIMKRTFEAEFDANLDGCWLNLPANPGGEVGSRVINQFITFELT